MQRVRGGGGAEDKFGVGGGGSGGGAEDTHVRVPGRWPSGRRPCGFLLVASIVFVKWETPVASRESAPGGGGIASLGRPGEE